MNIDKYDLDDHKTCVNLIFMLKSELDLEKQQNSILINVLETIANNNKERVKND